MCCSLLFALIGACQSSPNPRRTQEIRATPGDAVAAERRIYAFTESPLLLPLAPARTPEKPSPTGTASAWRPSRVPTVQYDSGAAVDVRLLYFEVRPQQDPSLSWLPSPGVWSVIEWSATLDPAWKPAGGFWALLVPPPPGGARQVLRFNGSALPVFWLPRPPASTNAARAPRLDVGRDSLRALGAAIAKSAEDPLQAWRIRILTDRIRASELWATPPNPPADPALAALADQIEARWRAAIGVLEGDDPALGAEFVARLTAVVGLPSGAALPAWPPDDSSLGAVRAALLAPSGTKASRAGAVRSWLASTPSAVAWVIDDSGPPGPPETARQARVMIANLTDQPAVASSAPLGKPAMNAARLAAHQAARFNCAFDAEVGVIARAGGWSAPLPMLPAARRAEPPGLLMGPLIPRWDLPSLLAGTPRAPDPGTACVAMLQRSVADPSQWEIYVECSGARDDDVVSLWLGPFEAPSSVVRIGPGASGGPPIHREGSRWWALVSIPTGAAAPDEPLLIGIARAMGSAVMWSWPRPVAPGQTEPGRAAVDLSAWGSMLESQPAAHQPVAR